jgi:hypothetical protein
VDDVPLASGYAAAASRSLNAVTLGCAALTTNTLPTMN